MRRTSGARTIRGTVGDGPEDVLEDIAGRVDIVYVVSEWCRDDYRQRCIGVEMDGSIYTTLVRAISLRGAV